MDVSNLDYFPFFVQWSLYNLFLHDFVKPGVEQMRDQETSEEISKLEEKYHEQVFLMLLRNSFCSITLIYSFVFLLWLQWNILQKGYPPNVIRSSGSGLRIDYKFNRVALFNIIC